MASGGHLGFSFFFIFRHMAHFCVNIRVYMSNFVTIGLTVQKLLAFTFSIGNALKVPKKLGSLEILGVKTVILIFLTPKRHLLGRNHVF